MDFNNVIKADYVILATPAGPTLSIEFEPHLSNSKWHALRNTKYTSSNKVILVFENPFWERNNSYVGGSSITDLPVRQIYYEMNKSKTGMRDFQSWHKIVLLGREIGNPVSPEIPVPNPDFRDLGSVASGFWD